MPAAWFASQFGGLLKSYIAPSGSRPAIVAGLSPSGATRYLESVNFFNNGAGSISFADDQTTGTLTTPGHDLSARFEMEGQIGFEAGSAADYINLASLADKSEPYSFDAPAARSAARQVSARNDLTVTLSDYVPTPPETAAILASAGVPTARINLLKSYLRVSASAGVPVAAVRLTGPLARASASAGVPTASVRLAPARVRIAAHAGVPVASVRVALGASLTTSHWNGGAYQDPIVLALVPISISGADITAQDFTPIGTSDIEIASNLSIGQLERHVSGSEIRLRSLSAQDTAFSSVFNTGQIYGAAEMTIVTPARTQIKLRRGNQGGGYSNWNVADSSHGALISALATGDRIVLAIALLRVLETVAIPASAGVPTASVRVAGPLARASASAGAPVASVRVAGPLVRVSASAGVPTASVRVAPTPIRVSASAGVPTAHVGLKVGALGVSASAGAPTASVRLAPARILVSASAGVPVAAVRLTGPLVRISAHAGVPVASVRVALGASLTTSHWNGGAYQDPIVLALVPISISGADITAQDFTPIGTSDIEIASNLSIGQLERHVSGSEIRLRSLSAQDTAFSSVFNTGQIYGAAEMTIVTPARTQIKLRRGNQGGGYSNWNVADSSHGALISALATGDRIVLAIALLRVLETVAIPASAGVPTASVRLAPARILVSASAGAPVAAVALKGGEPAVSASAGVPVAAVRVAGPLVRIAASAGVPTASVVILVSLSISGSAGVPSASVRMLHGSIRISASAGRPSASVELYVSLELRAASFEPAAIAWEVTMGVGRAEATNESISLTLTNAPIFGRRAVLLRHDPKSSPGLFK